MQYMATLEGKVEATENLCKKTLEVTESTRGTTPHVPHAHITHITHTTLQHSQTHAWKCSVYTCTWIGPRSSYFFCSLVCVQLFRFRVLQTEEQPGEA